MGYRYSSMLLVTPVAGPNPAVETIRRPEELLGDLPAHAILCPLEESSEWMNASLHKGSIAFTHVAIRLNNSSGQQSRIGGFDA
jgi:hypothetical protein